MFKIIEIVVNGLILALILYSVLFFAGIADGQSHSMAELADLPSYGEIGHVHR